MQWYYNTTPDTSLDMIKKRRAGAFVYIESPTPGEIVYLKKHVSLDPSLVLDALDPEEVPRAEYLAGVAYLFVRVPVASSGQLETEPVLIAFTKTTCCLITQTPLPFFRTALQKAEFVTTRPLACALDCLFIIAAAYDTSITQVNKNLYKLRRSIEKITPQQILRFIAFEEETNDSVNSLTRMVLALRSLAGHKKTVLDDEEQALFDDLILELEQLLVSAKNNLRSIKNTHDAYTAIMTNNLNREIKLFTSLTVILTIPTIVASLFGMNVQLPLQNHPYGFAFIISLILVLVVWLLFLFNKNDWL